MNRSDIMENEVDWNDHVYYESGDFSAIELDMTDYAALFIASLETIFLPLVVMGIFLFVLSIYFTLLF
jgi:hypothetical protein